MEIRHGKNIKIGLIQVNHIPQESREERYANLFRLAEACLKDGAELVFFPEAYQHAGEREILDRPQELKAVSEEWKARCSALASKYHAYVAPWEYEVLEDGKIYNSTYILDRTGKEVGRYRKCHLTNNEQIKLTRGNAFPVFELDFGKVGIMICFDNYFPESARCLGVQGAELVLYPLYGDTLNPQWETKLRTRAIDNSMYIACAQIDMHAMDNGICYSGLIGPKGDVLCRLEKKDSYQVVEIEMGRQVLTNLNAGMGMQEDLRRYLECSRNPEAYTQLTAANRAVCAWDEICNYSERLGWKAPSKEVVKFDLSKKGGKNSIFQKS